MPPVLPPSYEDETYTLADTDGGQVRAWRFDALLRLGVEPGAATDLTARLDVAHQVEALILAGCPAEVACRILL